MLWINSTDLKLWAPRRDCQENLPLLIRKLIRAHTSSISSIKFPAGDNILLGGWDGILESSEENEYIPKGVSVWEFGANKDKKTKANGDFAKRTADPLGVDSKNSTYIFVTPYTWQDKDEWCKEKLSEGNWKDIRIYDGEMLEEWLELSPAVGAWLAKHIGKYPTDNIQPTDDFWEEWSTGPKFNITPELVLAGRINEINLVSEKLLNPPCIVPVQAASRDEAIAFIISAMIQSEAGISEDFFSRSLIVDDLSTFRVISANKDKLILIVRFEDEGVINKAVLKGHHVILPIGADSTFSSKDSIQLPRLERESFVNSLIKIGIREEDAKEYSKESSRNLTIFRRQHGFQRNQPVWAKSENALDIIPALLVGRWNDNKEGDKDLISFFANEPYDTYIKKITKWINVQDSPFYKIGSKWRLASPLDSWSYLGSYITASQIEKFRSKFLEILKEIHPEFELEDDKRAMASYYVKESKYSSSLKEGLCQSLILIAIYGEDIKISLPYNSQLWCDSLVKELFDEISLNLCCTLDHLLPLISEASPNEFMGNIDKILSQKPDIILGMFTEIESFLTPRSYYTGLLWALEGLAWFPEYISMASKILANLAKNDPGGRLNNRPINSLRAIYLPWHPNTYCNVDERMEVLRLLINENPEVAWDLLLSILPKYHDVGHPTVKTRWRKFHASNAKTLTYQDIWDVHSFSIDSLIALAGLSSVKLAKLVEHIDMLSSIDRAKVIKHISENHKLIENSTNEIWGNLRNILNHHRSHLKAKWAISVTELDEIDKLYNLLKPDSIIENNIWLFEDHYPKFPDGIDHDKISFEEHEQLIINARKEAFNEIYNQAGFEGIIELTSQIPEKGFIGDIAGYILNDTYNNKIIELLKDDSNDLLVFIENYVFRKYIINGLEWLKDFYHELLKNAIHNKTIARLLLSLPQDENLWDFISSTNNDIEKEYWLNVYPRFYSLPIERKIFGIEKLLSANRYIAALDTSSHFVKELPTDKLIDILLKVATEPSKEESRLQGYEVEWFFNELDSRTDLDIKIMPQLEWFYLPILSGYGIGRAPKYLAEELSNSPSFFVDVLSWIYKSQNDNEDEESNDEEITDEIRVRRAELSYKLLDSWRKIPGTNSEGLINYTELKNWILASREIATKKHRLNAADLQIGKLLAGSPQTINDWLQESICKIIDDFNSEYINDGFSTSIFNKRGVVSKAHGEGGDQERHLAELFKKKAESIAIKYPITSSLLLNISKRYEDEAKREDNRSELEDLEY